MAKRTADPTVRTAPTAPTAPASSEHEPVPRSISRVLDLLEVVLAAGRCNLSAAAAATSLTPTTALRYLRALESRGYLRRDDGDFSAGPTMLRIAASLRGASLLDRLTTLAQPHLDRLAARTGESSYLAIGDGRVGTYIATSESPRAIRHVGWIGQDVDLSASALGAALAEPGVTAVRTGAIEPDITAMSRAVPSAGGLSLAISIVGPEHRFAADVRADHEVALVAAVDALAAAIRSSGEDVAA